MSIQNNEREKKGSALILVVIVTVLLSVVGMLFVMTMRMREMTTANVTDDRDLDTAVGAVTEKIGTVLLQDLFGTDLTASIISNEPYDSTTNSDSWLASLEPSIGIDGFGQPVFYWSQITDLFSNNFGIPFSGYYDPQHDTDSTDWDGSKPEFQVHATNVLTKIISEEDRVYVIRQNAANWSAGNLLDRGARADADGDGVADSRWIKLPNMSSSKNKPVYAAVRIIDNCAMLNLNTANCFQINTYTIGANTYTGWFNYRYPPDGTYYLYQDSTIIPQYYKEGGRYLSEINYWAFLRGNDSNFPYRILATKKFAQLNAGGNLTLQLPVKDIHDVLMNIESPGTAYSLFDIGDELEIRNRFTLTSKVASRFKRSDVANFTLDSGGGLYFGLNIPVDDSAGFDSWKIEMNTANFEPPPAGTGPNPGYYDRRHMCTFYSFDRNIRSGSYTQLDTALQTVPAAEAIFRPLDHRPIDLRTMTDPNKLDDITGNLIANPSCITEDTPEARRNILHLLYAFREYCFNDIEGGFSDPSQIPFLVARKAAQIVANMIDYLDDPASTTGPFADTSYGSQTSVNPTYINEAIIDAMILEVSGNPAVVAAFDFGLAATDTIYGYERQPFISEVYCQNIAGGTQVFALELVNPYDSPINLNGWRLCFGVSGTKCDLGSACTIPAAVPGTQYGRLIIWTANTAAGYSAPAIAPDAIYNTIISTATANGINDNSTFGLGSPMLLPGNELRLQRPDPDPAKAGQFLTVDRISDGQRSFLSGTTAPILDSCRKETDWGFVNMMAYPESPTPTNSATPTLGAANIISSVPHTGYSLPVADTATCLSRLADFQKITFVGNGVDPNCITSLIADAYTNDRESDVRFDYLSFPPLLKYLCTLNRPEGNLPGRININTAPVHVIAAAIPPQLVMTSLTDPNDALAIAGQIVAKRHYENLGELLTKVPAMSKYATDPGAPNVGDPGIRNDFEERDWIINRLSNIFTVRSDTFTAYILVRLGTDGPQRRMIAIFDRSNCWTATDKPKLVALHPVPDPR
jgi:hypothetical protein